MNKASMMFENFSLQSENEILGASAGKNENQTNVMSYKEEHDESSWRFSNIECYSMSEDKENMERSVQVKNSLDHEKRNLFSVTPLSTYFSPGTTGFLASEPNSTASRDQGIRMREKVPKAQTTPNVVLYDDFLVSQLGNVQDSFGINTTVCYSPSGEKNRPTSETTNKTQEVKTPGIPRSKKSEKIRKLPLPLIDLPKKIECVTPLKVNENDSIDYYENTACSEVTFSVGTTRKRTPTNARTTKKVKQEPIFFTNLPPPLSSSSRDHILTSKKEDDEKSKHSLQNHFSYYTTPFWMKAVVLISLAALLFSSGTLLIVGLSAYENSAKTSTPSTDQQISIAYNASTNTDYPTTNPKMALSPAITIALEIMMQEGKSKSPSLAPTDSKISSIPTLVKLEEENYEESPSNLPSVLVSKYQKTPHPKTTYPTLAQSFPISYSPTLHKTKGQNISLDFSFSHIYNNSLQKEMKNNFSDLSYVSNNSGIWGKFTYLSSIPTVETPVDERASTNKPSAKRLFSKILNQSVPSQLVTSPNNVYSFNSTQPPSMQLFDASKEDIIDNLTSSLVPSTSIKSENPAESPLSRTTSTPSSLSLHTSLSPNKAIFSVLEPKSKITPTVEPSSLSNAPINIYNEISHIQKKASTSFSNPTNSTIHFHSTPTYSNPVMITQSPTKLVTKTMSSFYALNGSINANNRGFRFKNDFLVYFGGFTNENPCDAAKFTDYSSIFKKYSSTPVFAIPSRDAWINCPNPAAMWYAWRKNFIDIHRNWTEKNKNFIVMDQYELDAHSHIVFLFNSVLYIALRMKLTNDMNSNNQDEASNWIYDKISYLEGQYKVIVILGEGYFQQEKQYLDFLSGINKPFSYIFSDQDEGICQVSRNTRNFSVMMIGRNSAIRVRVNVAKNYPFTFNGNRCRSRD